MAPWAPRKEKMVRALVGTEPGGVAGLPTLRGLGPAQDCYRALTAYREAHPKATWVEIYREVPNHYANAKSMASAMSIVKDRLMRRARLDRAAGEER